MKKIFLSAIAIVSITLSVHAQVPNYSFENWTNMGTYYNPDGWGTLNNTTNLASVYTAEQGTPGIPGSYYLKLTSKTAGPTVANGIAVSGVLDSTTMQPKSGFAFASRPASLTGKWQHMIFGSSQGYISVTLTRWDAMSGTRETVATKTTTLSGMAMSWASFTITLNYLTGNNPDTCIIVLAASGANPTNNDYLWVDNLAFTGTVAGVEAQPSFLNAVNVYPNPTKNQLSLDLSFNSPQHTVFEMFDMEGNKVLSVDGGIMKGDAKQMLDVSSLAKGTYLLRIVAERGTETRNVVIE